MHIRIYVHITSSDWEHDDKILHVHTTYTYIRAAHLTIDFIYLFKCIPTYFFHSRLQNENIKYVYALRTTSLDRVHLCSQIKISSKLERIKLTRLYVNRYFMFDAIHIDDASTIKEQNKILIEITVCIVSRVQCMR